MPLQTIQLDLPADILLTLNESEEELKRRIKTVLAVQLYSQAKVTIGKAAQIAGLTRSEFEELLSKNQIPISNLSVEDVLADLDKLQ